jgi:hypothetical protein
MAAVAAILVLVTSGCLGGGSHRHARYEDEKAAIRQIDALLASFPQYPGAHLTTRMDNGTSYHVPDSGDEFIEAVPYGSDLYYDLSRSVSGSVIQRYFRGVMRARGWSCTFQRRSPGVPYGFSCSRRGASLGGYIADQGHYELMVQATHARPPIRTIPGD